MKETPLLFKPEMVRATLREIDPKDQTRRLVNRLRRFGKITQFGKSDTPGYDWHFRDRAMRWHDISDEMLMDRCPYGKPGDRLWAKETYLCTALGRVDYRADGDLPESVASMLGGWRPSIFMFRRYSRILLEITDIRVERLQDISEADAIAEGIEKVMIGGFPAYRDYSIHNESWFVGSAKDREAIGMLSPAKASYRSLWNHINGAGSWDANPYVWVISFKRIEP